MTDANDMNTETQEPQEATEPTEPTEEEHAEGSSPNESKPHKEAARYRTQLREAENQLQVLTERLSKLQKADILRHAGEHLDAPEDLFGVGGHTLDDFLDAEGEVNPEKVKEASEAIVKDRPGLASRVGAYDRYQAYGGKVNRELNWADLFKTK